jgi:hypothetical protein
MFYLTGSDFSPRIFLTASDGDGTIFNGPGFDNRLTTTDLVFKASFIPTYDLDQNPISTTETFYIASNGADGQDAFSVMLGTPTIILPSNDIGEVTSYEGSGTNFLVYEGLFKLTGSLGPTSSLSESQYTVRVSSSLNITSSSSFFINNDNEVEIGNHNNMDPGESYAEITYLVYTNDLINQPIKIKQTFNKVTNGVSPIYYYIKPVNGTVIKNKNPNTLLELQIVKISGSIATNLTSGDYKIYSGSTVLTESIDGIETGSLEISANYNPKISSSFIGDLLVLSLKSGSDDAVDTITLADVNDGGISGYITANSIHVTRNKSGIFDPSTIIATASFLSVNKTPYECRFTITPQFLNGDEMKYNVDSVDHTPWVSMSFDDGEGNPISNNTFVLTRNINVIASFVDPFIGTFDTSNIPNSVNEAHAGSDNIKATETFYINSDGQDGLDAYTVNLTNETHAFTSDRDGNVTDYTNSGTRILAFRGINKLTASLSSKNSISASEFTVEIFASSSITGNTSFSVNADKEFVVGNHSDMVASSNTASIEYYVYISGSSEPIRKPIQTFSKSKEGALGPGVVFRGEWDDDAIYYYTDGRRDIVFHTGSYWYTNNPARDPSVDGYGDDWGEPGDEGNDDWTEFGQEFDAVATNILFAQDVFVNRTLNVGASGENPVIAINPDSGSYENPYISLGQTPAAGFRQSGIYLGYNQKTASLSLSSSNSLFSWKGGNLVISGSDVNVETPSFYLGGASQFISGSGGTIEISSSNFHLKNGNITASNGIFSGQITATTGSFTGNVNVGNSSNVVIGPNAVASTPIPTAFKNFNDSFTVNLIQNESDYLLSSSNFSLSGMDISAEKLVKSVLTFTPDPDIVTNTIRGDLILKIKQGSTVRQDSLPFSYINLQTGSLTLFYTAESSTIPTLEVSASLITRNVSSNITSSVGNYTISSSVISPTLALKNTGLFVNYGEGEINIIDLASSSPSTSAVISSGGGGGTVSSITAGSGLSGGTITTTGTISLNTGSAHFTGGVKSKLNADGVISGSSQVDHDATTNFVANEHIDHSTVSITAGSGLSGGGTIAATRTLSVDSGSMLPFYSSSIFSSVSGDITINSSTGVATIAANSVALGTDTTGNYVGTITAGTGIDTTGATTGEGIAHTISVDVSDFMTNGVNNRVLTATGTDAMNAEANLTFNGTDLITPTGGSFYVGTTSGARLRMHHNGSGAYIDWFTGSLNIRNNVTDRITIAANGNTTFTGTITAPNFILSSDRRLKSNITGLNEGLKTISKLNPKEYSKNGNKEIGFITDEIPKELDFLVKRDGEYEALDYISIIGVLVKSIQELKEEIETLKSTK